MLKLLLMTVLDQDKPVVWCRYVPAVPLLFLLMSVQWLQTGRTILPPVGLWERDVLCWTCSWTETPCWDWPCSGCLWSVAGHLQEEEDSSGTEDGCSSSPTDRRTRITISTGGNTKVNIVPLYSYWENLLSYIWPQMTTFVRTYLRHCHPLVGHWHQAGLPQQHLLLLLLISKRGFGRRLQLIRRRGERGRWGRNTGQYGWEEGLRETVEEKRVNVFIYVLYFTEKMWRGLNHTAQFILKLFSLQLIINSNFRQVQ